MEVKPEGYAIDKRYPEIIYVPEAVHFDLHSQKFSGRTRTARAR